MSDNCDVVVIFLIYGQFGETQRLDFKAWSAIHKVSLIVTFYLKKTENRTKSPGSKRYIF